MDGASKVPYNPKRSTRVLAPVNLLGASKSTTSVALEKSSRSLKSTDLPSSPITSSSRNDLAIELGSNSYTSNDPVSNANNDLNSVATELEVSKKKRGATRNSALAKKRKANEKIVIDVSEESGRIIGNDAQSCITEAGCVVRKHASFQVEKWSRLSATEKENLFTIVKDSLGIEEQAAIKKAIFKQLNAQYRNVRHKLYKFHFKIHPSKEEAIRNRPEGVKEQDWRWLCDYFSTEEFKKMSLRNSLNRAKQDTPHTSGTKSFERIRYEKQLDGNNIGQIQLYNMTHFSEKKNQWVREQAKENFEKMKNLQAEAGEEGVDPNVEEEICAKVLGQKSGYIRGRGPGPKPKSLLKNNHHPQVQQARKRAEDAEQRAEEAEQKFEQAQARIGGLEGELLKIKENQEETNNLLKQLMEKRF